MFNYYHAVYDVIKTAFTVFGIALMSLLGYAPCPTHLESCTPANMTISDRLTGLIQAGWFHHDQESLWLFIQYHTRRSDGRVSFMPYDLLDIQYYVDTMSLQTWMVLFLLLMIWGGHLYTVYLPMLLDRARPLVVAFVHEFRSFVLLITTPKVYSTIVLVAFLLSGQYSVFVLPLLAAFYYVSSSLVVYDCAVLEKSDPVRRTIEHGEERSFIVHDGKKYYQHVEREEDRLPEGEMEFEAPTAAAVVQCMPLPCQGILFVKNLTAGTSCYAGNFFLVNLRSSGFCVMTNKHILEFVARMPQADQALYCCTANNVKKAVRIPLTSFMHCAADVARATVGVNFPSVLGISPTKVAQMDLSKPVTVIGARRTEIDGKVLYMHFASSGVRGPAPIIEKTDGSGGRPEWVSKRLNTATYSTEKGCSGSVVTQNGRVVGIHVGSMRNYNLFVSLVTLVDAPKSSKSRLGEEEEDAEMAEILLSMKKPRFEPAAAAVEPTPVKHVVVAVEENGQPLSGVEFETPPPTEIWEDTEYDTEEIMLMRTDPDRIRKLKHGTFDRTVAEMSHDLWSRDDKSLYREFEREIHDLEYQGYTKNSREMKALLRKHAERSALMYENPTADFQNTRDRLVQQGPIYLSETLHGLLGSRRLSARLGAGSRSAPACADKSGH